MFSCWFKLCNNCLGVDCCLRSKYYQHIISDYEASCIIEPIETAVCMMVFSAQFIMVETSTIYCIPIYRYSIATFMCTSQHFVIHTACSFIGSILLCMTMI